MLPQQRIDSFGFTRPCACPAAGGTAAELVLGLALSTVSGTPTSAAADSATPTTAAAPGGVSDGGAFEPPVLTCTDWMRRGALAERLNNKHDAQMAYRAAVKLSFNLTSYLALMRLAAEAQSINNTALCVSEILSWHHKRAGQPNSGSEQGPGSSASTAAAASAGSGGLVLMGVPPADVAWALGWVTKYSGGLEAVRRGMADVPPAAQAMLMAIVDDWMRWQHIKMQPVFAARQLRQQQ